MPKQKSEKMEEARQLFLSGEKLINISKKLDLPEGTVRRWKCEQNWDGKKSERSEKKKANVRKRGGQKGNTNAAGQTGNTHAEKHGFFTKWLPEETRELFQEREDADTLDILWAQIQLAQAAIVRAQKIAFVKDTEDKTVEKIEEKSGAVYGEKWEVQQAWDKQGNFMKAQARAQTELRSLIKQYEELLSRRSGLDYEEKSARIAKLKKDAGMENAIDLEDTEAFLSEAGLS